jgi:hypothetical protein
MPGSLASLLISWLMGSATLLIAAAFHQKVVEYFYSGCSKISRCKAREILRNEAYIQVRRNDEG